MSAVKRLYILFLGFIYNTKSVDIKIIKSIILFMSKYHIPILKHNISITDRIKLLIMIDTLLSPLAYQEIYANNGDNKVMVYHIII